MGSTQTNKKMEEQQETLIDSQQARQDEEKSQNGLLDEIDDEYQQGCEYIINEKNMGKPLALVSHSQLVKYPYDCIGLIVQESNKGEIKTYGTGFLISSNYILTAAHVVIDKATNRALKNLKFYIDFQSKLKNPIQIKSIKTHPEYNQNSVKYDYALCLLQKEVKRKKYITLVNKFNNDCQKIMIAGYSGLCQISKKQYKAEMMFSCGQQKKSILSISHKMMKIRHMISTDQGVSGSPVLINQSEVIGIHKGSITKITKKSTVQSNISVLINSNMIKNIKQWSREMDQSKPYKAEIINYLQKCSELHQHSLSNEIPIQQQRSVHLYNKLPFCCIGRIISKNRKSNKRLFCNGILISQNLVLTVMSGVFKGFKSDQLDDIDICFYLGIKSNSSIQYQIQSSEIKKNAKLKEFLQDSTKVTHRNFLQKIKDDFCLLKLKSSITNCPKYMPLLVNYNKATNPTAFYGYTYTEITKDFNNYLSGINKSGVISSISIDKKIIEHKIKTQIGQAGSPLIAQDKLIGFHKFKHEKQGKSIKIARLITIDLVQELFQWKDKLKGADFQVYYYKSSGQNIKISNSKELQQHYQKDVKQL